jgi:hypothetical protein
LGGEEGLQAQRLGGQKVSLRLGLLEQRRQVADVDLLPELLAQRFL